MNLKFDSVFLSKIRINDSEFTYSEKGKSGTIPISQIEAFEVVEGTITEYGYLKITTDSEEHVVHFISNHNKGLRQIQEKLGFSNQTEPSSVKEMVGDYNKLLELGPTKIQIKGNGIHYKTLGQDGFIKSSRIISVEFKPAELLSLGSLVIHTSTETIEIKIPAMFNKALERWQKDVEQGIYETSKKRTRSTQVFSNSSVRDNANCNTMENNNIIASEDTFGRWSSEINLNYEQVDRILKAKGILDNIIAIDVSGPVAQIRGSEIEPYTTTLNECNCVDFLRRGMPCKHIYALAIATGNMCWTPEYKPRSSIFNVEVEIEKYKILYRHGDIKAEAYVKICSAIAKAKKSSRK